MQIAKVYRSGTSEFFGVFWPSLAGFPCLQGQEFKHFDKPGVRYFDPDTFEVIEDQLPEYIGNLDALSTLDDFTFVQDCYPEGSLKSSLNEKERDRLLTILRAHCYSAFIEDLKKAQTDTDAQEYRESLTAIREDT